MIFSGSIYGVFIINWLALSHIPLIHVGGVTGVYYFSIRHILSSNSLAAPSRIRRGLATSGAAPLLAGEGQSRVCAPIVADAGHFLSPSATTGDNPLSVESGQFRLVPLHPTAQPKFKSRNTCCQTSRCSLITGSWAILSTRNGTLLLQVPEILDNSYNYFTTVVLRYHDHRIVSPANFDNHRPYLSTRRY